MNTTIAKTILAQLGGNAFVRMTGARNFVGSDDSLSFRLPWPRVNAVRITLEPSDTYTMVFMRIRGTSIKEVARHEDVYFDMLTEIFRSVTGLETRMPNIKFR